MPASVAQKMKLAKGEGRLLEPEEFDKLREEGYMNEKKEKKKEEEEAAAGEKADGTNTVARTTEEEELDAFLKEVHNTSAADMAEKAAEAAVQEAEYEMMAAEGQGQMDGISAEAKTAENKLKHVSVEDVEDEDL
jgi:type IV secretory pathway VirD2 relaxase